MSMGRHLGTRLTSVVATLAVAALLIGLAVATLGSQAVAFHIDPADTASQIDGLTPPLFNRRRQRRPFCCGHFSAPSDQAVALDRRGKSTWSDE